MTKRQNAIIERNFAALDGALSDAQLESGLRRQQHLDPPTMPNYRGPKLGVGGGSIAQGDTLDNTLTENGTALTRSRRCGCVAR